MADESLPPDAANRIADAVEDIERNVARLRELRDISREAYTAADRQDLRDAVERKFVKLTEAVLDVAATVLRHERDDVPDRRKGKIAALRDIGVIDRGLETRLSDAVEFRDVLAHTYGPVVNDDLVYDALQTDHERYVAFVEAIHTYLSEETP